MNGHSPCQKIPRTQSNRGFTLIELMTAIAVVMMLLMLVLTMLNSATTVTTASRKHLDADSEARLVFDRMAGDFNRMMMRTDLDYLIVKTNGNDSLYFYSEAPALSTNTSGLSSPENNNSAALIGYRVNSSLQLERLGLALQWNASPAVVFLTYSSYPNTNSTTLPLAESTISGAFPSIVDSNSTNASFSVLGEDVFRFEVNFLLKPFVDSNSVSQPAVFSNLSYDTRAGHTQYGYGLEDVKAIIVTLAILDDTSRKLLAPGTTLNAAAQALPDTVLKDPTQALPADSALATLPGTVWQGLLDNGTFFQQAGLPKPVATQVRIYQRFFPLPSN